MKFIEVHMPLDDYIFLKENWNLTPDKWQVFGVYDEEISIKIKQLYTQIRILKSNEKKAIKAQSDKSPS